MFNWIFSLPFRFLPLVSLSLLTRMAALASAILSTDSLHFKRKCNTSLFVNKKYQWVKHSMKTDKESWGSSSAWKPNHHRETRKSLLRHLLKKLISSRDEYNSFCEKRSVYSKAFFLMMKVSDFDKLMDEDLSFNHSRGSHSVYSGL